MAPRKNQGPQGKVCRSQLSPYRIRLTNAQHKSPGRFCVSKVFRSVSAHASRTGPQAPAARLWATLNNTQHDIGTHTGGRLCAQDRYIPYSHQARAAKSRRDTAEKKAGGVRPIPL